MMRILQGALAMLLAKSAIAEPNIQGIKIINGSYQVSDTTITEKLIINGEAVLGPKTIVKKEITVNGSLKAEGVTFEANVNANGSSYIQHSIFKSNGNFSGNLIADQSEFVKNLLLLSNQTHFISCKLDNIIIRAIPYVHTSQVVTLKNNSIVSGDVKFEGGRGEVYIDNTSNVLGSVIGGNKVYQ